MSDYRPRDAYREGFPWIPVILIGGILISAGLAFIVIVTQHLWFFADTANAKHQIAIQQLQQQSPQYHEGWETKLSNDYASTLNDEASESQVPASDLSTVKAAVLGDAQSVCYDYAKAAGSTYTDTPADITSWYSANCSGSSVSLTSPLRK